MMRLDFKDKVVTLCGSMKFKNEMLYVEKVLSDAGRIVFLPDMNVRPSYLLNEDYVDLLHRTHASKILLSDAVLIIDVDNYIGADTKREISYAEDVGVPVSFLSDCKWLLDGFVKPPATYQINVTEFRSRTISVEAFDVYEAQNKAIDMYKNKEIVLNEDDKLETTFEQVDE